MDANPRAREIAYEALKQEILSARWANGLHEVWTEIDEQALQGALRAILEDFGQNRISEWLQLDQQRYGPYRAS